MLYVSLFSIEKTPLKNNYFVILNRTRLYKFNMTKESDYIHERTGTNRENSNDNEKKTT